MMKVEGGAGASYICGAPTGNWWLASSALAKQVLSTLCIYLRPRLQPPNKTKSKATR